MTALLAVIAMLLAGAISTAVPVIAHRRSVRDFVAVIALLACLLGAGAAGHALVTDSVDTVRASWSVPYGSFTLHLDALSALFLLPIFVLGGLGIVYGRDYLAEDDARRVPGGWCWYYLFLASMTLVTLAHNAVLFLAAWEGMSVAAFFLVTYEDDDPAVRQAGWTFLIAAHLGTSFLFAMFALLGRGTATLDFDQLRGAAEGGRAAVAVLLLALAGFGTKAGLVPAHVWLPAAHPVAPSHVSAVLSGAMLNTGIYGLLRTLTLLPSVPSWGGGLFVAVGLVSGGLGIVFALAQRDMKRLLADSSIENMGLITLGIGIGLIGVQQDAATVAVLGFAGALLHVLNHSLFKGLLFLNAGAVLHATGTRDMEQLGGLLRRMPRSGALFLFGAAAIAALPPLNGFASELLLYLAAFQGLHTLDRAGAVALLGVILGLALIGGLVAATFLRAALAFVGEPRSERAQDAHDPGPAMLMPMIVLAVGCVAIGVAPFAALRALRPAIVEASGLSVATVTTETAAASAVLMHVSLVAGFLLVFVAGLTALRARLLRGRPVASAGTWATAYRAPTPRMQYTGSSFAQPLTRLFRSVLQPRQLGTAPVGYFPRSASFGTETPGLFRERVFVPAFAGVAWVSGRLRWLQHGRVQLYLLNIAATLVILLVWKLGLE